MSICNDKPTVFRITTLTLNTFPYPWQNTHYVVYQTKGINKLRNQGIDIPDEILASLSPYWTEHFNRFGIFQLDMDYNKTEIEYDLVA